MSFTPDPIAFWGPTYSETSGVISFGTSSSAGVTTGTTFQAEADDDVLTFVSAHNLKVGDRVRVTEGSTLPTGLAAATDYWVASVPSTTTLTLAATKGGDAIDLTTDGSADNTLQAFGPFEEATDTEADASTGDWRKVWFAICEGTYQKQLNTPTADRPSQVTITRSSSSNETTGIITRTYTSTFKLAIGTIDVNAE